MGQLPANLVASGGHTVPTARNLRGFIIVIVISLAPLAACTSSLEGNSAAATSAPPDSSRTAGIPSISSTSSAESSPSVETPHSPASSSEASSAENTEVFALAEGMPIHSPARRVRAFAYHESLFDSAIPLRPQGHPKQIDNPNWSKPSDKDGPAYIVMASRGRTTKPTTGVDIVLDPGSMVVAPVTGEVVDTSRYKLYCQTPDLRVIIKPDSDPDQRVVLFHFADVVVSPGARVIAGSTPIGHPRVFTPHNAQYDQYVPGGRPHVHLEVESAPVKPLPGCTIGSGR